MRVILREGYTITSFKDGTSVIADHYDESKGQWKIAEETWYESAEELNRDHDVTHHLLAKMLGLAYSPALYKAAHDEANPDAWVEEAAVLAIQRFANQQGISLIEVAVACGLLRSREQ